MRLVPWSTRLAIAVSSSRVKSPRSPNDRKYKASKRNGLAPRLVRMTGWGFSSKPDSSASPRLIIPSMPLALASSASTSGTNVFCIVISSEPWSPSFIVSPFALVERHLLIGAIFNGKDSTESLLVLFLRSKRDAGLKMRNARCDQHEKSERLDWANEETKDELSHLCGIYVESASAIRLKCHTISITVPL